MDARNARLVPYAPACNFLLLRKRLIDLVGAHDDAMAIGRGKAFQGIYNDPSANGWLSFHSPDVTVAAKNRGHAWFQRIARRKPCLLPRMQGKHRNAFSRRSKGEHPRTRA